MSKIGSDQNSTALLLWTNLWSRWFFRILGGSPHFWHDSHGRFGSEATFFVLTIYAWTTKSDVTGFGMYLFAALLVARLKEWPEWLEKWPGDTQLRIKGDTPIDGMFIVIYNYEKTTW